MEAVGAAASIVQLIALTSTIIRTIYQLRDEAAGRLARASRRASELELLQATLQLVGSSLPSVPDSFQRPLMAIREHLKELDSLLAKISRPSPKTTMLGRLLAVPGLLKTESRIVEGMDRLERAKTTLVLHLSAAQGRTSKQILERVEETRTALLELTRQRADSRPHNSNPPSVASSEEVPVDSGDGEADTQDSRVDHRPQGDMVLPQSYRPADATQYNPESNPPGTTRRYRNTPANSYRPPFSELRISGSVVRPPQGSYGCHIGNNYNGVPTNMASQESRLIIERSAQVFATRIGNNVTFVSPRSFSSADNTR